MEDTRHSSQADGVWDTLRGTGGKACARVWEKSQQEACDKYVAMLSKQRVPASGQRLPPERIEAAQNRESWQTDIGSVLWVRLSPR